MKAEILWESPETTPAGDPFLTVKRARGYYYYAERGGVDSIAFIVYDKTTGLFGLIRESKPPLDERMGTLTTRITAAGGSIDCAYDSQDIALVECQEEMGFPTIGKYHRLYYIGTTLVSTQMSQECLLYLIDVSDLVPGDSEEDNELVWLTEDEVIGNQDWKSIYILTMAKYRGII